MEKKIRVMLADDHQIVLDGLEAILQNEPDIMLVAKALDGLEVQDRLVEMEVDVLVLDLSMPRMDGLTTLRALGSSHPGLSTVVLSFSDEGDKIEACIKAGAKGYVVKNRGGKELVTAIRKVAEGDVHFPDDVMKVYTRYLQSAGNGSGKGAVILTDREREVMACTLAGLTAKETGVALHIAHSTVESHKKKIREKYNIQNIADITRVAMELGIEPYRKA